MNEPNQLENLLHSWTPRCPSPELRAKIFSREADEKPRRHPALNWLAPAAISAFTMFVMLAARTHHGTHSSQADTNLFFASITMNSVTSLNSSAANSPLNLSKMDLNLEQNVWRTASFESTNRPETHSSRRSLPKNMTNRLTR